MLTRCTVRESLSRLSLNFVFAVTYTTCGDESVGNQSLWWHAVEPDQQCFGMSMPGRSCSRSTTKKFHCLAGSEWDSLRTAFNFPSKQRSKIVSVEMGNWLTATLAATVGRIVLEEMMNFQVSAWTSRKLGVGARKICSTTRMRAVACFDVWADVANSLTLV